MPFGGRVENNEVVYQSVLNEGALSAFATVNIAAVTGIRHVITSIDASLQQTNVTQFATRVRVNDSSYGTIWSHGINSPATAGIDRFLKSGLKLVGSLGGSFTVFFINPVTDAIQILAVSYYDTTNIP